MIELSREQAEALVLVVSTLDANGIPYQITGGLAGNLHGSRWPLHDIDIEVDGDLGRVSELFAKFLVWGPGRYCDEEFELWLVRFEVCGVVVEINSTSEFFVVRGRERIPVLTDLRTAVSRQAGGNSVRVQALENLISYKKLLGRAADIRDLEGLSPRPFLG